MSPDIGKEYLSDRVGGIHVGISPGELFVTLSQILKLCISNNAEVCRGRISEIPSVIKVVLKCVGSGRTSNS